MDANNGTIVTISRTYFNDNLLSSETKTTPPAECRKSSLTRSPCRRQNCSATVSLARRNQEG